MPVAIVFPPPPPTSNCLTYQQRAQLLRRTKKLERVLGAAPHIIDAHVGGSPIRPRSLSRCSNMSTPSASSASSMVPLMSRKSPSSSAPTRRLSRKSNDNTFKMKHPVLRLAVPQANQLETLHDSPLPSSSSDEFETHFVLTPIADDDANEEWISPSFMIPSNNSLRRQKLDRLRKRLGDGIPLELIFPHEDEDSADSDLASSPSLEMKELQKELPPLPRESERTISTTRDSLILMTTSPARAHKVKRKPVPQIVASRPAPAPPSPKIASISSPSQLKPRTRSRHAKHLRPSSFASRSDSTDSDRSTTKARLSLILESPDEHGNTVIEEVEVSLLSATTKWRRSSGYDFDQWFEGMGL